MTNKVHAERVPIGVRWCRLVQHPVGTEEEHSVCAGWQRHGAECAICIVERVDGQLTA